MGGLQMIDYAMLKHAEGNWLSNFDGDAGDKTGLRVRNMAWWRSPAIPATALVIGNPEMHDPRMGNAHQIDCRRFAHYAWRSQETFACRPEKYRAYADWLQNMQTKYDIMSYRQDLPGFGEPQEGMWDGYQRLNTETKKGGMIAVFRHGAVENKRTVTVNYLDPGKNVPTQNFGW
jgi:alpha-galactosidase